MLKSEEEKIEQLKKQVDLYQELVELVEEEQELLKQGQQTVELKDEQREIRDEIAGIDLKFNLSQGDKLKLMAQSDDEKLKQLKPTLQKLYDLEKENQELVTSD
ncbi:flagellar biosynthesis protein FlgN [Natroniella sulfidigena]|uniref:flagellar biosynthesis protein FlgN n=1 Tax=Natroniella sulfidigena TaxID=723921 RepID=UPI00200A355B|nr:flagellar biosynthesis protein FlgN [Natroniella sulfidigena]MCK8816015.1 flagellar biosynthesis protein FlgN [Natroniella sulfidigena]